ncbi:hypothetical protein E2C01_099837 [Portunus trituberculatus]|uniref:Uncharacterized protein n=1 Tax=Portunus trituberculatus TaxID=210409 RepID=A0A5B7KBR7_PORTR|nr:hypothetical protein [Portunus trituberculatus]
MYSECGVASTFAFGCPAKPAFLTEESKTTLFPLSTHQWLSQPGFRVKKAILTTFNALPMLDGSLIENSEMEGKREREKRLSFTLWVTTSSTFTITSTSINSATTFSLSFYCTVSNASFPPRC